MKKPFGFIQAYYVQEKILEIGVSANPEVRMEQLKASVSSMERNAE